MICLRWDFFLFKWSHTRYDEMMMQTFSLEMFNLFAVLIIVQAHTHTLCPPKLFASAQSHRFRNLNRTDAESKWFLDQYNHCAEHSWRFIYFTSYSSGFFFLVCCYSISFEIVCRMLFVFNMYSKSIKRTVSHRSEISLVCVNIVRMIVFFLLRFVCIFLFVFGEYIIFKWP